MNYEHLVYRTRWSPIMPNLGGNKYNLFFFQGVLNIYHKPVLDVPIDEPLKSFIGILDWNYLYIWVNLVCSTEANHLLYIFCTTCNTSGNSLWSCRTEDEYLQFHCFNELNYTNENWPFQQAFYTSKATYLY